MDTSNPMPSGGFIEGLNSLMTPDLVSKAGSVLGDSPAAVAKGLGVALPVVFGTLASKAGDRPLMSRVFDLVNDPAAESTVNGNLAANSPGNRFLSILFGGNRDPLDRALGRFAGVRPVTAASMLSLAAPMVLGYLGKTVRREGVDAFGLSNLLIRQKRAAMQLIPNSISSVLGFGPQIADTTHRTADTLVHKSSPWRWVLPVLLVITVLWELGRLFGGREQMGTITKSLPGGISLKYAETGIEGKLLSFIDDVGQRVESDVWFDFDRLLFETDSAVLRSESRAQLGNIAAILKAYPNVHIKVGGYTDSSGDPVSNMKLSQERANRVVQELAGLGIVADRLSAEGYGQDHPVADNATEDGRTQNRRVAVRVTNK